MPQPPDQPLPTPDTPSTPAGPHQPIRPAAPAGHPGGPAAYWPAPAGYPGWWVPQPLVVSPPPRAGASVWTVVAAAAVGGWAVLVTTGAQAIGWLVEQILIVSGLPAPSWMWLIVVALNALLVAGPAALLAVLPRARPVRTAGRTWLLGALVLGLLGALRAVPSAQSELYLAGLSAMAAALAAVLTRLARRTGARRAAGDPAPDPAGSAPGQASPHATRPGQVPPSQLSSGANGDRAAGRGLALAAGVLVLVPWLWVGALGGLLESVLAVTAAVAVGWLAATVLDERFWAAYSQRPGRLRLVGLGGLVAGVFLVLLAGGLGASGQQLAEFFVLPPLAFAAAALAPSGPVAVRWLVAAAAVGPLALTDNEEITLLLIGRDVPLWTAVAAGCSLLIALLSGVGYAFTVLRPAPRLPRRAVATAVATTVLLAAGAVYVSLGQPGLYGERLFVVLRDQADLSSLAAARTQFGQAARNSRAQATYKLLVEHAERTQAPLRRELDRMRLDYTPYYLVNAIEVDAGPAVGIWLSRRDDVDRVLRSQQLRPLPAGVPEAHGDDPAPSDPQWNVTMIGADRAWSELGATGAGIVVGTSDSGVDGDHPALAPGFRGGPDSWYDPWTGSRTPVDRAGHGTHTLASAVGRGSVGVAPEAQWIGCVNLERNLGNPARYLDCLQFMLAPFPIGGDPLTDGRPSRAPNVLTNSWGCPPVEGCDQTVLRPATAALAAAGIFVVAAAGNTGPFCSSVDDPPAPYPDVFTVGAVDSQRRVSEFSSRGPAADGTVKPDVVAPGEGVLSAMPGGGYTRLDGTSMATPHVAGVVALMWSVNPALIGDIDGTAEILRQTAAPVATTARSHDGSACSGQPANTTGAGLVDAFAAVQRALQTAG